SFFFSSRRRHTSSKRDWSSDVCSSDLPHFFAVVIIPLCCYLLSWRAWFGSETSVYRHAVESGLVEDATALAESPLGFLPDSFLRSEERRVGTERRPDCVAHHCTDDMDS